MLQIMKNVKNLDKTFLTANLILKPSFNEKMKALFNAFMTLNEKIMVSRIMWFTTWRFITLFLPIIQLYPQDVSH